LLRLLLALLGLLLALLRLLRLGGGLRIRAATASPASGALRAGLARRRLIPVVVLIVQSVFTPVTAAGIMGSQTMAACVMRQRFTSP
jgi:hypothetical protein